MLDFVLCDDNQNVLNKFEKMLESILIKNNLSGQVAYSTTNPDNFIKYIQFHHFDAVILDIDLKANLSGMDLANTIRKMNKKAYIIFSTAHLEYLMVAYKYKTFDFLAKPITYERFEETILRLFDDISDEKNTFFKINNKNGYINSNNIYFIEKRGKKAIIKTSTDEYSLTCSFSNILNRLPDNFKRCHKSFIVNIDKISSIQPNNEIRFTDDKIGQCQIGPKYEKFFIGG